MNMKTFLVVALLSSGCVAAPAPGPAMMQDLAGLEAEAKRKAKTLRDEISAAFEKQLDAGETFGYKDASYGFNNLVLEGDRGTDYMRFSADVTITRGGKSETKRYVGSYNMRTRTLGKG